MIINNDELEIMIYKVEEVLKKENIHEKLLILNTLRAKYAKQIQDQRVSDVVNSNPLVRFANKLTKGMREQEDE